MKMKQKRRLSIAGKEKKFLNIFDVKWIFINPGISQLQFTVNKMSMEETVLSLFKGMLVCLK